MAALARKLQAIVNEWTSCADCDDEYPEWAELKHGIIICLQCAGIHRSLGTHISQVRSLTLDVWQSEWVDNMHKSNHAHNAVYEYYVPSHYVKPKESSSRELRTRWITAKYVELLFHSESEENEGKDALSPTFDDIRHTDEVENHGGMIQNTGVLYINCLSAVNLPKGNALNSKKSAFCVFDNGMGQSIKTKIVKKSNNPQWNETHLILSINEHKCEQLKISIFNKTETDEIAYEYFDLKKHNLSWTDMIGEQKSFRDFAMVLTEKYARKNKNKSAVLFNFDIEYNKMDFSSGGNDRKTRQSLILDNTKIIATEIEMNDSSDASLSCSSSSASPVGRPGDTTDTKFVAYDKAHNHLLQQPQRVRLTRRFSAPVVSDMSIDTEIITEMKESEIKEIDIMEKLVRFNNGAHNDTNGTIDALKQILTIDNCQILVATIRRLNDEIFGNSVISDDREMNVDTLRNITNSFSTSTHAIHNELLNLFLNVLSDRYGNRYNYLIHHLDTQNVLIFNALLSAKASQDDIEYVLTQIQKNNMTDMIGLIGLIVPQINNNNIRIKQKAVTILSKFSADIRVQQKILASNDQILRILSLIDCECFVNIAYNMLLCGTVHYSALVRIVSGIDIMDRDTVETSLILGLIGIENIKQNRYLLSENELIRIIDTNLNDSDRDSMIYIAKSAQMKGFLEKTQCALKIQSYFRSFCQQRKYCKGKLHSKAVCARAQKKDERIQELLRENARLTQELHSKENERKESAEREESLRSNNDRLQQQIRGVGQEMHERLEQLKMRHLNDKQQFAMKMMTEMNKLREELKNIGKQQRIQQEMQLKQEPTSSNTLFSLWS